MKGNSLDRQEGALTGAKTCLQASTDALNNQDHDAATVYALQGILTVLIEQLDCYVADTTPYEPLDNPPEPEAGG